MLIVMSDPTVGWLTVAIFCVTLIAALVRPIHPRRRHNTAARADERYIVADAIAAVRSNLDPRLSQQLTDQQISKVLDVVAEFRTVDIGSHRMLTAASELLASRGIEVAPDDVAAVLTAEVPYLISIGLADQ